MKAAGTTRNRMTLSVRFTDAQSGSFVFGTEGFGKIGHLDGVPVFFYFMTISDVQLGCK